jgi:hypothetical protein
MKFRLTLVAVLFVPGLWGTTYTLPATNYTVVANFTSCTTGSCANFTTSMAPSGSFTTAAPLASNLANQNVAAQVTSFTFTDGITTYNSSDATVRVYLFMVTTNASGNLSLRTRF